MSLFSLIATAYSNKFQNGYYVSTLSDENGVFYVGITRNWKRRYQAHKARFGERIFMNEICYNVSLAEARVIETGAILYYKSKQYDGRNKNIIYSISNKRYDRNILYNKIESDILLLLGY